MSYKDEIKNRKKKSDGEDDTFISVHIEVSLKHPWRYFYCLLVIWYIFQKRMKDI